MARTGSNIYKRKDGRYEGRILIGKNSRRKPKYIYIYAKTLREVKRKMSEVQALYELHDRDGFLDIFVILMPVVMESDKVTVIFIDA